MSEEKKDYVVGTGPDGEPVVKFSNNPIINSILTEKALEEDVPGVEETLSDALPESARTFEGYLMDKEPLQSSSGMAIRTVASRTSNVEVAPGVMVSQHLIDAAVNATVDNPAEAARIEAVERKALKKAKEFAELKQDISASHKFVQEMFDRMRNPMKYDEKYVSFDQMPKPLQRVVNAYMAVSDANKELEEAIKALQELQVTTKAA